MTRPQYLDTQHDRRFKEGMLWPTHKPPSRLLCNLVVWGLLLAGLSVTIPVAVWALAEVEAIQAKLDEQHAITLKYSGMVAAVMNGQTLFDEVSGNAFFFDKPTIVNVRN